MNRDFPTRAALAIALDAIGPPYSDHALVCRLGELYEILAWLVGDIPTVEQLPRFAAAARTVLIAEHPQLFDVTDEPPTADADEQAVLDWLATQEALFGATITITRGDGVAS